MKSIIVLAMHGAPPNDFPGQELGEFFALHGQMAHAPGAGQQARQQRHDELHAKMRAWPRTAENDPFYAASVKMAGYLSQDTGQEVIVGFGEFCGPTLDEALDQAVAKNASSITVVTPMMTRGGEHAERDIPAAMERARARHPGIPIEYVWPFSMAEVARFLATQIEARAQENQKGAAR
jgi:sirohydrochlorin cobaltochelatase